MDRSIRVQIMGRTYSLLVDEAAEGVTREMAAYVHDKMEAFRETHPEQSELTAAVITALAVTEELFTAREEQHALRDGVSGELARLDAMLEHALADENEAAPSEVEAGEGGTGPGGGST